MKTVLFTALIAAALVGCKRNHSTTKEAINGAFGWALGSRLPAAFDVQTNNVSLRYIDPRGNVPPFDRVVLDLSRDRTIYAITGTFTSVAPEPCQALEKSLVDALAQKYRFKKKTMEEGVTRHHYGDVNREAILAVSSRPPTVALCYRDIAVARQAQQEVAAVNAQPPSAK